MRRKFSANIIFVHNEIFRAAIFKNNLKGKTTTLKNLGGRGTIAPLASLNFPPPLNAAKHLKIAGYKCWMASMRKVKGEVESSNHACDCNW